MTDAPAEQKAQAERIQSRIIKQVDAGSPLRQRIFHWAMGVGREFAAGTREGKISPRLHLSHALAERLNHPAAALWDERINSFYVQNNYPDKSLDSELERVAVNVVGSPTHRQQGSRQLGRYPAPQGRAGARGA